MDKVIGGTPRGSRSLCHSCRFAQVMRGINMQEEIRCLRLGQQPPLVRFPVADCNVYESKSSPSLYQMEQIAWQVTSRHRGPAGFGVEAQREVHIEPPVRNEGQPAVQMPVTG